MGNLSLLALPNMPNYLLGLQTSLSTEVLFALLEPLAAPSPASSSAHAAHSFSFTLSQIRE